MKVGMCAALLAVAACSQQSTDGSTAAGPAGEVVAMNGKVVAARAAADAEPRELSVSAPVFADDTITTEAASEVTIKLAHNGASWRLAEKRSRRLDESLAWKAPPGQGDSALEADPDDHTAAAGRHTEREAAQGRGTAMEAAADEVAEPPAKSEETERRTRRAKPKTRRSKGSSSGSRKSKRARGPHASDTTSRSLDAPVDPTAREPESDAVVANEAPRPPPPPPAKAEPKPAPSPPTGGAGKRKTRGSASTDAKAAVGSRVRSKVKTCHALAEDPPAGKVTATVTVDASGTVTTAKVSPSIAGLGSVASCARGKLVGMKIDGAGAGTFTITISLR